MTGEAHDRGFTLIEMMVALLIFSILASAGISLLSFAVKAQAVAGAKLDDIGALDRLGSAMAADLAQAVPRATRNEAGDRLPAFTGAGGSGETPMLRLVRGGWANVDGAARPGEQKVEYRLVDGTVERVAYPMLDGAAPLPAAPMLSRVAQVTLRYRYKGAWSARWEGRPDAPLPDALEIGLTRPDGVVFRELFVVGSGYGSADVAGGAANGG